MSHLILDIKYKTIMPILYDVNLGEKIMIEWSNFNDHEIVFHPISYVFPKKYKKKDTIVNSEYNGYTAMCILKESHISIHTYPESKNIQLDFFSCKSLDYSENLSFINEFLKKDEFEFSNIKILDRPLM